MWSSIILNCVLSITIIFIVNHIWDYCKTNYTSQRTKDLVEMHASKYKQIAEDMERNDLRSSSNVVAPKNDQTIISDKSREDTIVEFLPKEEKEWINRELAKFIETL